VKHWKLHDDYYFMVIEFCEYNFFCYNHTPSCYLKRAKLIRIILVRGLVQIGFLGHQEDDIVVHLQKHGSQL